MQLDAVYVRFYRSLNYDYLRKTHPEYSPEPWDATPDGASYPFIRVRLERDITTIVGANESGKSQLLGSIKHGLTGQGIERRDFCRYSSYFSTDGTLTTPEFGLRFGDVQTEGAEAIAEMCGLDETPEVSTVALFRMNATPKLRMYLLGPEGWVAHTVKKPTLLEKFGLPHYFEIDASVPLPDAVPLEYLATGDAKAGLRHRGQRRSFTVLRNKAAEWFTSAETVQASAAEIAAAFAEADEDSDSLKQFALADDLLIRVVGLERELFSELLGAVARGQNGYAGGIIDTVNREIANRLNFPHWWSQDSAFELLVDLRQDELVFMIRDRTGTSYSFDERSAGMKYFLSYFVQYLSHEPREDGGSEILLMDEPDAYLSSSGQQDLLRIFDSFAHPDDERPPVQVVYVTHSPFLIDKNHAERLRVLEKGEHEEGTRIVANASRNHYEPLRSAFGSFVGETTFIGTCNLLLEGPSDQILIAGVSSWLAGRDTPLAERLDLNTITLVPAGSASHIPYVAFLARGRDVDRPPVIVLLDADKAGDDARAALLKGGPRGKQLVAEDQILQLRDEDLGSIDAENPQGCNGLEDLVPLSLAHRAVAHYCHEYAPDIDVTNFVPAAATVFQGDRDTLSGLQNALRSHIGDASFDLDKIGFARSVVAVVQELEPDDADLAVLQANFRTLLGALAKRQRLADRRANSERISGRIKRAARRFLADHPTSARREHVLLLKEEIEDQLDATLEADEIRAELREWVREFQLEDDLRADIEDYSRFRAVLAGLAHAGTRAVQIID
jgi:predicted ATPase